MCLLKWHIPFCLESHFGARMGADVPGEGFGKGAGVASSSSTAASSKDGAAMPPPKKFKGNGSDEALSLPHGTPEKPPEEPLVDILNFKFLAITVDPLTSQEFLLHRTTAELYTLPPCDTKYEVYNFGGEGYIYLNNKAIWARDILQWVPKHSETANRKFKETDKLNMDKVVVTLSERAKAKASEENRHCRVGLPDFMCCAKYSMVPIRIADHPNGQIEIKVLSLMRARGGVATFWSLRDLYIQSGILSGDSTFWKWFHSYFDKWCLTADAVCNVKGACKGLIGKNQETLATRKDDSNLVDKHDFLRCFEFSAFSTTFLVFQMARWGLSPSHRHGRLFKEQDAKKCKIVVQGVLDQCFVALQAYATKNPQALKMKIYMTGFVYDLLASRQARTWQLSTSILSLRSS